MEARIVIVDYIILSGIILSFHVVSKKSDINQHFQTELQIY